MNKRGWISSTLLIAIVVAAGGALTAWKQASNREAEAAAASQPEPMESISVAVAKSREFRRTTTSIGTVLALRSITLRNEIAGTIDQVNLAPGQIVEAGELLVALDVHVELAELKALEAQSALAETVLARLQRLAQNRAAPEADVDRAIAERDVALAQIARTRAIIDRKTIRAPFRARIGLADAHRGQFLEAGTELTTLQGVDDAAHVDFTVAQHVASTLRPGEAVEIFLGAESAVQAEIVAVDARIDPLTRNAAVRARIDDVSRAPAPGASVRVRVPVGPAQDAVAVPVSALRKGPGGDVVFVVAPDPEGRSRAHARTVQSGAVLGDEVIIHSGLKPGEKVAAAGSFKLRETVLVAIANEQEVAAAARPNDLRSN